MDPIITTDRLDVRAPDEADRAQFIHLFGEPDFMVFSGGTLDAAAASARFDVMLANAAELPYAKRPVIERATGEILGYCGVAWFEFEGERRLEFGYRLVPTARGRGFATEAGRALLGVADGLMAINPDPRSREIIAMIDPTNEASQGVAAKLGFTFWKMATVHGFLDQIHRRSVPSATDS